MDKLTHRFQLIVSSDLLFEEILHRFHIMVGGALDILDPLCIFLVEFIDDIVEQMGSVFTEGWYFRDVRVGREHLQPTHLH